MSKVNAATQSVITTSRNSWNRCYSATSGGIYYLPKNAKLVDTDSTYIEIAGNLGGVMYCDSCTAVITNPNFEDTNALNGGVFYFIDGVDVTLDGATMKYGMALNSGGAIYAVTSGGDVAAKLTFSNCGSTATDYFQIYQAGDKGGFFYVNNGLFDISSSGCNY